ncbi:type II toxin-antitoxin system CcdA family antitoxin [Sphaerisporangium sp. NPDC005288]|uniref:type II toxin-antitoxin system CcdA family antitoxin n=1 Tax=Sphaerisporangium sp. NPDC005288 TaxID=3155114 RepID=UPI0033B49335
MSKARKRPVTVTVDADLVEYAEARLEEGDVRSLSAYVNDALAAHVNEERRAKAAWAARAAAAAADTGSVERAECRIAAMKEFYFGV